MAEPQGGLTGQVGVVTGGGRGIGAAISEALAELGALVVLTGRSEATLRATAARIRASGGQCEPVACDLRDLCSVQALATRVEQSYRRLDILVNNAGVGDFAHPLHELSAERWDDILNTNLRGVFYCIRALAPLMIRGRTGHIVNISSIAGKNPLPNGAAYAASKWGLNGLSYSVAEELRKYNIRVSVVCPGSTASELSPHAGKDPNRMLQPTDIARVVTSLVTEASQAFISEVVIRPTQKP